MPILQPCAQSAAAAAMSFAPSSVPACRALYCIHYCSAIISGCSLLIIIIWAGGMAPTVLYFGTTIYVDFNMWRQNLKIPTIANSTDPLATFVWHEEYETVNLREHIAAHATYRHRTPFPHTVIDDIIPQDLLERVNAELPEDSDELG